MLENMVFIETETLPSCALVEHLNRCAIARQELLKILSDRI